MLASWRSKNQNLIVWVLIEVCKRMQIYAYIHLLVSGLAPFEIRLKAQMVGNIPRVSRGAGSLKPGSRQ